MTAWPIVSPRRRCCTDIKDASKKKKYIKKSTVETSDKSDHYIFLIIFKCYGKCKKTTEKGMTHVGIWCWPLLYICMWWRMPFLSLLNMTYVAELEREEQTLRCWGKRKKWRNLPSFRSRGLDLNVISSQYKRNDDRVTATVGKVSRKLGVNHFPSAV